MVKKLVATIIAASLAALLCAGAWAAEGERMKLPGPTKAGGATLLEALSRRHTSREFAQADLGVLQLADLLWATAGVNRADGKKTYPTAMGRPDMSVYVFNGGGVYRYLPESSELELIAAGDHRAETGKPSFVGQAAVNLAYVQDLSLWQDSPEMAERGSDWGFAHAGAMAQNAYLYAASQGWSAVVRGSFDQEALAKLMKLNDKQVIRLIHSIGPK